MVVRGIKAIVMHSYNWSHLLISYNYRDCLTVSLICCVRKLYRSCEHTHAFHPGYHQPGLSKIRNMH